MCMTCGCSGSDPELGVSLHDHTHEHVHEHTHEHSSDEGSADNQHVHQHSPEQEGSGAHSHVHSHSHTHPHSHGGPSVDPGDHEHAHQGGKPTQDHDHDHDHNHDHDRSPTDHHHQHAQGIQHTHAPEGGSSAAPGSGRDRRVALEHDILEKNNRYADENRQRWKKLGVFALNLVSSPGSGKTSLLVRTIAALRSEMALAVIEGDQQTSQDAKRIQAAGAPAIQINTGKGCHLEAHSVGHAAEHLPLASGALLLIENVGNLVCPSAFDLGEEHKVVILSVTEGEDKPIKYPDMFAAANILVLNKIDLLPYVDFDVSKALTYARRINPKIEVFELSSKSGQGFEPWLEFLRKGAQQARMQMLQSLNLSPSDTVGSLETH